MRFWFRKKKPTPSLETPLPEQPTQAVEAPVPENLAIRSDLEERLLQQEILLEQARNLKKDASVMVLKMNNLANSKERQLTFLLRKAQQEHRRQEKFLREAAALLHLIARYSSE